MSTSVAHRLVVERGQLLVLCSHAVVRNEFFHHRLQILAKLRNPPECDGIRGITLRAG